MTTITIKNGKNISRTKFENIDDLLAHFMEKMEYGFLLPLDKENLTDNRKKRISKALNTPKSQMLNIQFNGSLRT